MGLFRGVELADLTLSSDRLDLRPWRPEDAGRVHEALSDPATREFLVLAEPFDADAARRWVQRRREPGDANLDRAVVERASGRVVGSASLRLPDDPSVGYWIAPDARGHGYAAEAVRLLADWAFGLGVVRMRLGCDVRNLASVRTALAAGFAFEGVARAEFQGGGVDGLSARQADAARFARLATDAGAPVPPAYPPLPDGALSDGVLALRPARPDDATGFLECDDDESVRWAFDTERRTAADALSQVSRAGLDWLVGQRAHCTMLDVATGRYAGEIQVRFEGPPGVGGFGYTVHPAFRGRAYTTRALRLLVPWCFDVAGFVRLQIGAKVGNVASQRAALAAGFGPDGVRDQCLRNPDGSYADEACFVLLKPV